MQSNTYTAFCGFFLFIILNLFGLPNAQSQEAGDIFDLRFLTEVDCGTNVLTANIQIRTQDDTFKIGISSVLFNYDETVLGFLDYQSLNFDQSNICIPGVPLAVWDDHQFSSSTPGVFNLTLLTEIASQSCPIIERDWIDVGTVSFTIKDMEAAPNMQFDAQNTTFNRNDPNDGTFAPTQGDLMGFNELLSTQCACTPPTLVPDTLSYDCPENTIDANLLVNDITTNPTISISSNPTKGTATINLNGRLTYTPTTAFCGEDVLTYKVCNDGKQDCCTEAVVTLSFFDNTSPVIVDAPADVTVDCDALPVAPNIFATDNCSPVELNMNEVVEDGDCANSAIYVRTWTAIDGCGNTATHTQRITLIDQIAPTIECAPTFNSLCSDFAVSRMDPEPPTVSDNCTLENDIDLTFTDEVIAENCENKIKQQIARTWTAIDACGNLATCIQTINIIDDIAPDLDCPSDLTVDCGQNIDPEILESKGLAVDNCSMVTISFEDDTTMPVDCNFATKIITRTWTAVDACGNIASCQQMITVVGNPCSEVAARELTIYKCEKDIIDFTAILNIGDSATASIANKSDSSPIFNLQRYALPSTGCQIGQFEFNFEVYNAEQCLIDHGVLLIKTVPIILAGTQLSEDGCTASMIFECPDLYNVSWNAGTDSGEGMTYVATPGTSGEVVFSVVFTGATLPSEAASFPCVEQLFRINFNCETTCPQTENHQVDLTTCAGQDLNIIEDLNLSVDSLDYTFELIDSPLGVSIGSAPGKIEVSNPFGCEMGTFNLRANGYDANECLIKTIDIVVSVLPKIEGGIQYETDSTFCSPKLILECPSLYEIDWKDNLGGTGVGNTYTGTDGTGGFVTFFVYPIDEDLSQLPCAVDSFFADFSCKINCPTTRERIENVTVCAESEVDIIELLSLSENKRNTFDNENIIDGIYKVGNPFGCGLGTKTFTFKCFDENQCLVEIITLEITIIPAVYAGITTTADVACEVSLNLECPENYAVSWEDSNGNSGTGASYTGAAGTAGTVKFTVDYLLDSIFLSSSPLDCFRQVFEAAYECNDTIACPETIERIEKLTVCAESEVNIIALLNLNDDKQYVFENEDVVNGIYQVGNPFGCDLGAKVFILKSYDENQCLVEIITLNVTVIPAVYAEINTTADVACGVSLSLECPENYAVSWEDSNGNSGIGASYTGTAGTAGTVKFTVDYLLDSIFLSSSPLDCVSQVFEAAYECNDTIACPQTVERIETLTVCAESEVNIIALLSLNDNKQYIFEGEDVVNGIYQVGNPFGCDLGTKVFILKSYDENQCLVEIITIEVVVIPAIYGTIHTTADVACGILLTLECPENYAISWEDSNGNSGTGASFTGTAGTTGTVKFTVDYLTDSIFLSSTPLACFSQTFEAAYECISNTECPPSLVEDRLLNVCDGDYINIPQFLALDPSLPYEISGIELDSFRNILLANSDCGVLKKDFKVEIFDLQGCLTNTIYVTLNISPSIKGTIRYESDSTYCQPKLILDCRDAFQVTWADNLGNTGVGNLYEGTTDTAGFVTFYVTPLDSLNETFCGADSFSADFSCLSIACPTPTFETMDLYGCHGELLNVYDRLQFSDNILYRIVDGDGIEDIKNIRLENDGTDCFIHQFRLAIEVMDERGCVTRAIFVSFNVLPKISGDVVHNEEGCGLNLTLACPNIYAISWEDNLGNTGEGFSYEPVEGTNGVINFSVSYKDTSIAALFIDSTCYITTFSQDFACCNPAGTTCDDGDALTFNDVEDGNCGCFGTGCNLEHKGKVVDGSTLGGCEFLIELNDGVILEPLILPVGETLAVGQEIIFSFVELTDRVTTCQAGKNVQIICLENTCPVAGTPCTDNNLATINDEQDGNCNCVGETAPEVISEIDLRLRPELDCQANTYCLTLQAKGQQTDFTIGTSSIMLNYDPNALEFANYTSTQFDESETCIGGIMSPWDEQKSDGTSVPGKFCLTMTLLTDSISCPEITTENWEDIGVICFDIMNNDTTPDVKFDAVNTHFNSSSPNDGTRPITLGTLHGIDTDEALACEGNIIVASNELALKAFLQGPFKVNKSLMSDDLRKKGFIPLTEPYTGIPSFIHFGQGGGETTTLDVLEDRGDDAIIDWVFLELRSETDSTLVVATRSALIQSDGDVVDVDGVSSVRFMVPDGAYYITLKHRNHLGVMTAEPIQFTATETVSIDFTDAETATYGSHAQLEMQTKMVLRGGNANPDKFLILAGGGLGLPDRDVIFFDIFLSLWQSNPNIPITYNSVLHGYYGSDTNMDGKVKYQGPKNDIDAYIFFNVLFHPQNTEYRLNFAISEQIP